MDVLIVRVSNAIRTLGFSARAVLNIVTCVLTVLKLTVTKIHT